ncbi:MAG: glycoside hydrolase family 43 protein [Colwellia sp.]
MSIIFQKTTALAQTKKSLFLLVSLLFSLLLTSCNSTDLVIQGQDDKAYLFSSFRGNGEDGLHLAYSYDGLTWQALNNDNSFLTPKVGGKLMRDPCIILGPDNVFHMVWTSSWQDGGIGIAHSKDLINWSEQTFVPVMDNYPSARNAWAPEITWDVENQHYLIYWASNIPGKYPDTEKKSDNGWDHRIFATTTKDFVSYTDSKLFYNPGFNIIDSTIIRTKANYTMILKDETRHPAAKNLLVATSDSAMGPWQLNKQAFSPTDVWVEGPSIIKVGDWYHVYFDEYTNHKYGAMRTQNFIHWQNISDQVHFPKGTRHGTVFEVNQKVLQSLLTLADK